MSFPTTFLDLQQDVIDKARLDIDEDLDRIKDWLNNSYYESCIETNFFETSAVITSPLPANSIRVTIPSGVVKVEYVVPTGSDGQLWGPMEEVTFEELLEMRAYQGAATPWTGAPNRYAYRSSGTPTIEFFPQAVGGEYLTFYGATLPVKMVADIDEPIIPDPYRMVISYGALVDACEFQKDLLSIQQYEQQYKDLTTRLRGFNNIRTGSKVQQFRVEGKRPWPRANSIDQGY